MVNYRSEFLFRCVINYYNQLVDLMNGAILGIQFLKEKS